MDALFQPQQGIPSEPALGRQLMRRKPLLPTNTVSGLAFEQYLYNWQRHIAREQEKNDKLCEMSVTIHRRARGLTLSDQCGRFGVRTDTQGRWLDYDADLDGEIHPINIVGPAINTNQNACLQSNSIIEVSSANQNANHQQNALRWQRIADYFERTGWDEAERSFIFDAVQKDGTVLVYSFKEPVDEQTVAAVRERKLGLAVYQCDGCGMAGMTETEGADEGMQQIPCPECGKQAPAMVKPLDGYELEEEKVDTYKIASRVIPFYNFTIDSYGAKIKGIQGAKWLQLQELVDRMQIETDYPGLALDSPREWSYPLRCDYALASGAWDYLNRSAFGGDFREFHKFERRSIYLHQEAYSNYRAPMKYQFTNQKGKRVFAIEQGQSIEEAWERMYGFNPSGFKFVWIGERLVDIASPDEEMLNFRDCFADVHWRRDSGSYLSSPNYSIVTIQDDITLLNTMNHNIIARNAVIPVYYDSLVYEEADFSKEFIGSKNAHLLGEDRDMSKSVTQLPVPTPSPYLANQLQFLWGIKDDVTNVTPAMRGDAQNGETLGAVRQQLEQSYGGLTSVLKSFAQCKNTVFLQKAKIAKECWTVEQFQRVGSMFGEVWSEEDVEEMCEINFEEDLIVTYRTGSEMPQSNLDRELRFSQGLNALMPFIQAGVPLQPDKMQKILEKIDEMAGFDFDLTGLEIGELIAQKRYLQLAALCSQFQNVPFEQVEAEKQKLVAVSPDGQPITQMDLITEQIFMQSEIRFSQYEDLDQQYAFFKEQLNAETGKSKPNHVLLEMLNVLLGMLEQAQMEIKQQQMMNDPAVQAALAEKAANEQKESANAEREDAKAKEQQNADQTTQMLNMAQNLAGQEHELQKMQLQGQIDKANQPTQ